MFGTGTIVPMMMMRLIIKHTRTQLTKLKKDTFEKFCGVSEGEDFKSSRFGSRNRKREKQLKYRVKAGGKI